MSLSWVADECVVYGYLKKYIIRVDYGKWNHENKYLILLDFNMMLSNANQYSVAGLETFTKINK